ncbi:DUF397 domain-containing protein [Streptomyces sp. NPDC004609]|uniref:DUF397 domain-containing protein n=1 Tax=Streptomyces sp. NPDC004609 TaxID=3364704 RepID=UPI003683B94F
MTTTDFPWAKSSYSDNGGNCVEWAPAHASATGIVPVRDSKTPTTPILNLSATAFSAFVAGVKTGGFGSA